MGKKMKIHQCSDELVALQIFGLLSLDTVAYLQLCVLEKIFGSAMFICTDSIGLGSIKSLIRPK